MALTATATKKVKGDIVKSLHMPDCIVFEQSFNRANLYYEVRPKKKSKQLEEMAQWIQDTYPNRCGIVYCLSQKDCESAAKGLREAGINAGHYHAGMTPSERQDTHLRWLNDDVLVICATIAFGMGINKPDVRFVIHHSLPKTLEGYYQEAGRAGRDGLPAHCVLYYSYADKMRLQFMISKGRGNADSYDTVREHYGALTRVVEYCENKTDCRRQLVLTYFDETSFDPTMCNGTCDNCATMTDARVVETDVTQHIRNLAELMSSVPARVQLTSNMLLEVYRGSTAKKMVSLGASDFRHFGEGKTAGLSAADTERIIHIAVRDGILDERIIGNDYGSCNSYLFLPGNWRSKLAKPGYRVILKTVKAAGGARGSRAM